MSGAAAGTAATADRPRLDQGEVRELAKLALARGLELHRWWRDVDQRDAYAERLEVVSTFNRPDTSFAFFDRARVGGRTVRVMGDVEDLFYDRPKWPGREDGVAAWTRRQVREFVLGYFLRVSDYRQPSAFTRYRPPPLAPLFRPLSWCPDDDPRQGGFGYRQLYFCRRDGTLGAFPRGHRHAIVDLREVAAEYRWILLGIALFDFDLEVRPFGTGTPEVRIPLRNEQMVVLSPDFLCDQESPAPGVLGRYGFGYAVLRDPHQDGVLAYGPGRFDVGFQTLTFDVLESGEVRLRLVFAVNRPERLLDVSVNPVAWMGAVGRRLGLPIADGSRSRGAGIDPVLGAITALDFLTEGQAARDFCISLRQLEHDMLVQHFEQNYRMISGSLLTWRLIGDWLDTAGLPSWVVEGRAD